VASSEGASLPRIEASPVARPSRRAFDGVRDGLADWLPALPILVLAVVLLIVPTIWLVVGSVYSPDTGVTLDFWRMTLGTKGGQRAIGTSVGLGLVCATISVLIGGPLSWLISRMLTARRSVWLALMNVAANFGGIGLAFGYIAALGTFGMVTLAIQQLGVPFTPPEIGSFASLVLAYEYTNVPLFVLLTLPAMSILRSEWLEAAETCAATRGQFWRFVGMPILTPFLLAGWLLIFTWSIGVYGLAFALGQTAATTGQLRLITLQIGLTLNTGAGSEERAYVYAVVLLLLAIASLATYRITLKRALRWFV
jgi:putative spermidine/putrescine transport system permease protein